MLHKLTADKPHTWVKLIPVVFFAFREIPNKTDYPPFTLIYSRQVRGPEDIIPIHCKCSGPDNINEEYTFVYHYANQLHVHTQEIAKAWKISRQRTQKLNWLNREKREAHILDTESQGRPVQMSREAVPHLFLWLKRGQFVKNYKI